MNALFLACPIQIFLTDMVVWLVPIYLLLGVGALLRRRKATHRGTVWGHGLILFWIVVTFAVFYPLRGWVDSYNQMGRRGYSLRGRTNAQFNAFHEAISLMKIHTGRYPSELEDLVVDSGMRGWSGPYIEEISTDPWGNEFVYSYPAEGGPKPYQIVSLGADGVSGGFGSDMDMDVWGVIQPSPIPSSVGWAETFINLWDLIPGLLIPIGFLYLVIKIILGLALFGQRIVGWGPDGTLRGPPDPVA